MNAAAAPKIAYASPAQSRKLPGRGVGYSVLASLSLLLSAWLLFIDPLFNAAGVAHLRAAEAYLQWGLPAALALAPPLPALPIAMIHQFSGLSLLHAGLLVSSGLYALLCCVFVATCKQLGGERRVLYFAAVLILLLPMLNAQRSAIGGDPGYWALLLLSVRQLLVYNRFPGWSAQLRWLACVVGASLFHPEALLLALLAPLILPFTLPRRQRLSGTGRLLLPALLLLGVLFKLGWLSLPAELVIDQSSYASLIQWWLQRSQQLASAYSPLPAVDTGAALFGASLALVLVYSLRALGGVYALLLLLGWWRGWTQRIPGAGRRIIALHALLLLLAMCGTTLLGQADASASAMLVALLLLLYLPFVLDAGWQADGGRWALRASLLLMLALVGLGGLHNNHYRSAYLAAAAQWLHDNSPADAVIVSNSPQLAWLSRRPVAWDTPLEWPEQPSGDAAPWRYLALQMQREALSDWYVLAAQPGMQTRQLFAGPGNDLLVIFERLDDADPEQPAP